MEQIQMVVINDTAYIVGAGGYRTRQKADGTFSIEKTDHNGIAVPVRTVSAIEEALRLMTHYAWQDQLPDCIFCKEKVSPFAASYIYADGKSHAHLTCKCRAEDTTPATFQFPKKKVRA